MKDGPLEIRGVTICYVQMNKIPRWNAENTTELLEQSSEGNTFNSALLQKSLEALSFITFSEVLSTKRYCGVHTVFCIKGLHRPFQVS